MDWLKAHAFLTGWIALPFTIWAAITKLRRKEGQSIEWQWAVILIAFGISLGISFTPGFDQFARDFAKMLAIFSFMAILFSRPRPFG